MSECFSAAQRVNPTRGSVPCCNIVVSEQCFRTTYGNLQHVAVSCHESYKTMVSKTTKRWPTSENVRTFLCFDKEGVNCTENATAEVGRRSMNSNRHTRSKRSKFYASANQRGQTMGAKIKTNSQNCVLCVAMNIVLTLMWVHTGRWTTPTVCTWNCFQSVTLPPIWQHGTHSNVWAFHATPFSISITPSSSHGSLGDIMLRLDENGQRSSSLNGPIRKQS